MFDIEALFHAPKKKAKNFSSRLRFAVVGLGHFAQVAVLPAFAHAPNAKLTALVSGTPEKLLKLGKKYKVAHLYNYSEYEDCLNSGNIDAVYICLPNHLHKEYTIRAARAGIHVLCEKPMAVSSQDCIEMIEETKKNQVKLMIAYRLHFEEANLRAVETIRNGRLGECTLFNSTFSLAVQEGNIRTNPLYMGGGPVYDIGLYCINAARYLFQSEPIEVFATAHGLENLIQENKNDHWKQTVSASILFPENKIAQFSCSFSVASSATYSVFGSKGYLKLDSPYSYAHRIFEQLVENGHEYTRIYPKRDQIAPELIYFSNCVFDNQEPEPNGIEGLADIRVIEAIYESIVKKKQIPVADKLKPQKRPSFDQRIEAPPVSEPKLVGVSSPTEKRAA